MVIDAAFEVHASLGPGLNEALYEAAICRELMLRDVAFVRQPLIEVAYKDEVIGTCRLDLLVEHRVIVELKAIDVLSTLQTAQALCYLRATKLRLCLLINFNSVLLKDGLRRIVL